MKRSIAIAIACLAASFLPVIANAQQEGSYVPRVSPEKTTEILKHELETLLKDVPTAYLSKIDPATGQWMTRYDDINFIRVGHDQVSFRFDRSMVVGPKGKQEFAYSFYYDDLASLSFNASSCNSTVTPLPDNMEIWVLNGSGTKLCDLLYDLGQRYRNQTTHEAEVFGAQVVDYRARGGARPPMPEEQRRLIVQAEALRKQQDYAGAADLFRAALRIDSVAYPAAWYNLALLYEQQGHYSRAIQAMRRYLQIDPAASDARSAQDKIYEWEMLKTTK